MYRRRNIMPFSSQLSYQAEQELLDQISNLEEQIEEMSKEIGEQEHTISSLKYEIRDLNFKNVLLNATYDDYEKIPTWIRRFFNWLYS